MAAIDRAVEHLASEQYGVFSGRQAVALGASRDLIRRRARSGAWQRHHLYEVFRLPGHPPSWHQALWAAWLWGGPESAVSHRAAAALWAFDRCEPGSVEITVDGGRKHRPAGIRVHQSHLYSGDLRVVDGLRVTSPERTLVDIATQVREAVVDDALESAIRLGHTTAQRMLEHLDRRPGTAIVRELLSRRGIGRPRGSTLEGDFLRLIRRAGLAEPVRQHPASTADTTYYVDFAYPARRIAIELDGRDVHSQPSVFDNDRRRQNALVLLGWTILRFSWADVTMRPDSVVACLRQSLAA